MSEPNYNETVVIPLLQKKFQELTNQNLVLEANLLIEKEKNARLLQQVESTKTEQKRGKKREESVDGNTF